MTLHFTFQPLIDKTHSSLARASRGVLAALVILLGCTALFAQQATCPSILTGVDMTDECRKLEWASTPQFPAIPPSVPPAFFINQEMDTFFNVGPFEMGFFGPSALYSNTNNSADCSQGLYLPVMGEDTLTIDGIGVCIYSDGQIMEEILLPIGIASFEAVQVGNTVELQWTTAYEYENHKIVVERTTPGSTRWSEVATVAGKGTTDATTNYSAVDKFPNKGVNLYRLKDIDYDGVASYSGIRSVNFATIGKVFPNPMTTELNIQGQFELYDATGRPIVKGQDMQIDVSSYPPGIYIVRQGEVVQRVIKL